jgi:ribose/xylose/arabinose/galactoside ABC-type transport system permease subunit
VELTLTKGQNPQILFTLPASRTKALAFIGQGHFGPVTVLIILSFILVVILYFLRQRSTLGLHMDAIQGSVTVARLSSINVQKVFGSAFIISSTLCAIVGIMILAKTKTATPRGVESYLTDCFVATYVGTLFSKSRRFNVIGTVIGALFVGCLGNFFTLIGLGAAFRNICNGIFIIIAVSLSIIKQSRSSHKTKTVAAESA